MNEDSRTLWCGNLSERVTEELLYELFLQVAPLEKVRIPTDREGRKSNFGFVTLKHEVSIDYATQMLDGTELYNRRLHVKPRHSNQNQRPPPVQHPHVQNATGNAMMHNMNDLMLMGQMMQLNYIANNMSPSGHDYDNHHHHQASNRKPYDKHGRQDNYNHHNRDNRQGRSGHHRNNHQSYDRNRRARYY